jgi:hypothetical protein
MNKLKPHSSEVYLKNQEEEYQAKSPALTLVPGEGSRKTRLAVVELSELERLVEKDGA